MAEWFGALADVRIPVVCDVDSNIVGPVTKMVTESQGKAPVLVSDIRRVLDDKSIDAVVMATPIHWHAPRTILACTAGKDVYVEKPASHNVHEGRQWSKLRGATNELCRRECNRAAVLSRSTSSSTCNRESWAVF